MMTAIIQGFIIRAYDKDGDLIENHMTNDEVEAYGFFHLLKTNSRFVRHKLHASEVHLFHTVEIIVPDGSSYQEQMGSDGVWHPIKNGN